MEQITGISAAEYLVDAQPINKEGGLVESRLAFEVNGNVYLVPQDDERRKAVIKFVRHTLHRKVFELDVRVASETATDMSELVSEVEFTRQKDRVAYSHFCSAVAWFSDTFPNSSVLRATKFATWYLEKGDFNKNFTANWLAYAREKTEKT